MGKTWFNLSRLRKSTLHHSSCELTVHDQKLGVMSQTVEHTTPHVWHHKLYNAKSTARYKSRMH